jgi:hypothetical protein
MQCSRAESSGALWSCIHKRLEADPTHGVQGQNLGGPFGPVYMKDLRLTQPTVFRGRVFGGPFILYNVTELRLTQPTVFRGRILGDPLVLYT